MKKILKHMILAAAVAATVLGCGKKGSVPLGPAEVVEEFVRAVASGRTDDAMKLCDKNAMVEYIEAYEAALAKKSSTDSAAASIATGILSEIEFTVTEVSRTKGVRTVFYTIKDAYGDAKDKVATVTDVEGEWKVKEINDRN